MGNTAAKPRKRDLTRSRVIQAAIDCIYEEGFSAANTNRIADRAGVTWGVLQYHFGDKSALLQAVLQSIFADFADTLANAHLDQADPRGRIDALIRLIWTLVSARTYRVSVAIMRNTVGEPNSGTTVSETLDHWATEIGSLWDHMFTDLPVDAARSETARRIMFACLRGLADELNPRRRTSRSQLDREFVALGDAIFFLLTR